MTIITLFVCGVRTFVLNLVMTERRVSQRVFLYPGRLSCPQELSDIDETVKVSLILIAPCLF